MNQNAEMGSSEGLRIEAKLVVEIKAKVATVLLERSRLCTEQRLLTLAKCSADSGGEQNPSHVCQALKVHQRVSVLVPWHPDRTDRITNRIRNGIA